MHGNGGFNLPKGSVDYTHPLIYLPPSFLALGCFQLLRQLVKLCKELGPLAEVLVERGHRPLHDFPAGLF